MIARVWHGWTTPANADVYETLLREEIFPGIAAKEVPGYLGIELLRRELPAGGSPGGGAAGMNAADEVEFVTTMWFETLDDVRAFAGDDYETAYVPDAARAVLARFDATSAHYQVRERRGF